MNTRELRSWFLRIVLAVLCLLLAALVLSVWQNTRYGSLGTTDFIEYWSAGQLLLQREDPYDFERLLEAEKQLGWPHSTPLIMWNPPWVLVWLLPLLLLDFPTASLAWMAVNFGIILLCSTLVWSFYARGTWRSRILVAWLGGFFFAPAMMTLGLGQVSGLNLLGVVLFVALVRRNRFFTAGLALALTTAKIHIVYLVWPFVLWWILKNRRWSVAVGFASAMLASAGALTLLRPQWLLDYAQAVSRPPLYWATPTLGGILRGVLGVSWQKVQYVPPLVMLAAVLAYLVWKRPELEWLRVIGPLLLLSVITTAFGWSFDQIVLLVPYLEVLAVTIQEKELRRRARVALLASLISYSASLLLMNILQVDELQKFWLAWLLALAYWFSRRVRCDSA